MPAFLSSMWIKMAAVAAVLFGAYYFGYSRAETKGALEMSQYQLAQSKATVRLQNEAIDTEQGLRDQIKQISDQGERNVEQAKASAQSTIDSLSSGNLRLRKRLAAVSVQLNRAQTGAGAAVDGGAGQQTVGLQPADAEFLVRLAADADARSEALKSCVAIIQKDQQTMNDWYKNHSTQTP